MTVSNRSMSAGEPPAMTPTESDGPGWTDCCACGAGRGSGCSGVTHRPPYFGGCAVFRLAALVAFRSRFGRAPPLDVGRHPVHLVAGASDRLMEEGILAIHDRARSNPGIWPITQASRCLRAITSHNADYHK
jgi:hypothetical protein